MGVKRKKNSKRFLRHMRYYRIHNNELNMIENDVCQLITLKANHKSEVHLKSLDVSKDNNNNKNNKITKGVGKDSINNNNNTKNLSKIKVRKTTGRINKAGKNGKVKVLGGKSESKNTGIGTSKMLPF
jgi:hypothetical protein